MIDILWGLQTGLRMLPFAHKEEKGLRLSLYVQPGASKSEFAGMHAEALKLRIAARPEDGAANKAISVFLAEFFCVPKSSVVLLKGHSSRQKTVLVVGDANSLLKLLEQEKGLSSKS